MDKKSQLQDVKESLKKLESIQEDLFDILDQIEEEKTPLATIKKVLGVKRNDLKEIKRKLKL